MVTYRDDVLARLTEQFAGVTDGQKSEESDEDDDEELHSFLNSSTLLHDNIAHKTRGKTQNSKS